MTAADTPRYRQSDAEWLHALFVEPERALAQLPPWARPVVTPHREADR